MSPALSKIWLCDACGTSFPPAPSPPTTCPICTEERQFVPPAGQSWTSADALARTHRNAWRLLEPGLFSLQPVPAYGINQRALLLTTPTGNVLWDCIALLDPATEALVRALGGLSAIAISHPHYYTTMQDWSATFDAPIHLHAADRASIMRPSPHIRLWDGDMLEIAPYCTLLRLGGHYTGGAVLHWAHGGGILLAGDIVQVTPGADWASFMWSYPNMLPLPAAEVADLAARIAPWPFERIYGAFAHQNVLAGGSALVARSATRYIEHVTRDYPPR